MSLHPAFTRLDHRPWPAPSTAWTWRQTWLDLLFAHWPIDVSRIRHLVPEELTIQEFGGTSFIGLVPFRMEGVMRRPLPDLPMVSAFPELNVRLYVEFDGKPGVWFLSLDADQALAVWAARRFFHLPYFRAQMTLDRDPEGVHYESARRSGTARLIGNYRPTSDVLLAARGTLEHWLTERYCLYARAPQGELWRTEVHHHPWPLRRAEAELEVNTMFEPHGLELRGPPPLLHFADRLDVVVWSPERVS